MLSFGWERNWSFGGRDIFNNRRSEIDIMNEILSLTKDGARKTQILYKVNLSYTQLKSYLLFLITNDFIQVVTVDDVNPYVTYKVTDKGLVLMEDINKVMSDLC